MARTHLSVLANDNWLFEKIKHLIKQTEYQLGYSGSDEKQFIEYLKSHNEVRHILFVKPNKTYFKAYNDTSLRNLGQIDVIIIGTPLREELVALIQASNVSGYVTPEELNSKEISNIIFQVKQNGYYHNSQIPKAFWLNRPKQIQDVVTPQFTDKENAILRLMCHGFLNAEIATKINTSVSNVRNHIERIRMKAKVSSTTELVSLSVFYHWVLINQHGFKHKTIQTDH